MAEVATGFPQRSENWRQTNTRRDMRIQVDRIGVTVGRRRGYSDSNPGSLRPRRHRKLIAFLQQQFLPCLVRLPEPHHEMRGAP